MIPMLIGVALHATHAVSRLLTKASARRLVGVEIDASIYLANGANHDEAEQAFEQLVDAAGYRVVDRDQAVISSFFRRFRVGVDPERVGREVAMGIAHAADSKLVQSQNAQITATMMQHLPALIESIRDETDVVMRIGALVIIKLDGVLTVHQLTTEQQLTLNHEPGLSRSPRDLYRMLDRGAHDPSRPGTALEHQKEGSGHDSGTGTP